MRNVRIYWNASNGWNQGRSGDFHDRALHLDGTGYKECDIEYKENEEYVRNIYDKIRLKDLYRYAFRSISNAFRSQYPGITENLPIN